MWPILANIVKPEVHLRDKITYCTLINHVHNLKIEDEKQLKGLIEHIQELISSPVTRHQGLLLLDALQDQNNSVYVPNWGSIVLGSLKCPDFYISRDLTLRILTRNVRNFGAKPEYSLFFDKCIPGILALLLQAQDKDVCGVCETLAACMNFIPDIVAPHGAEIEKFLIKNMDCASSETVVAIAHCFALLPVVFVRGELTKGRYQLAWHNLCSKTLVTLQSLLNEILYFPGVEILHVDVANLAKLEMPPKSQDFLGLLSQIRIFKSLCHCLAQLLSTQSNGYAVKVPINDILKCLERIFRIGEISKVPETAQKLEVFRIGYPWLQHAAFLLFEATIVNYNIIDESGNFVKILLKSLETIECTSFVQNSFSQVRVSAWKLLNVWLNQYGTKGAYNIATDHNLLSEIMKDIDTLEDTQTKCKGISHDKTDHVSSSTLACIEASKALNNILIYGGSFVNKELIEKLFLNSLKGIRRIQIYWSNHDCFPGVYDNEKCRKRLYNLMQTFCIHLEPLQTKYVVQSLSIFRQGLKDPSIKVKEVCHRAYKLCRLFIHPKKPPPEVTIPLRPAVNSVPARVESLAAHWNNAAVWNVNGHSEAENFNQRPGLPVPSQVEQSFTETLDSNARRGVVPMNRESPSYSDDGDSRCNYNRTLSKNSSQSDEDSELECMEEERSFTEDVDPELITDDTYAPIVTAQQKVNSPHVNSLDAQPSIVEEKNGTEVEVSSEEILPEVNSCENSEMADQNPEEGFEDIIPEKIPENGVGRAEINADSEEDESGEEEEEVDEENEDEDEEDAASDYAMDRKRSPEYYDDRVVKRQRVVEEEGEEQSSDGEMNNNNEHLSEEEKVTDNQNLSENQKLCNQEVVKKEECEDDETEAAKSKTEDTSPSIKEMCRDFVLAEPAEIS